MEGIFMKRFEIYIADFPYGSETGTYVIILQNEIEGIDSIFCAPIIFGKKDNDKDNTHIQANTKNGKSCTIMIGHLWNLDKNKINGKIDELADEYHQCIKDWFAQGINI